MSDISAKSQHPRPRIESLTDLIFGLALSIGALSLLGQQPADAGDLAKSIALFAFSFLILMSIWLRYTDVMSVLPVETRRARGLNIILLFFVALEPYLYNLLQSKSLSLDVSTTAYALDIGSIYAILASFNGILGSKDRGLIDPELRATHQLTRDIQIIVSAVFFISAFPIFFDVMLASNIPIRYLFWFTSFFFIRGTWMWKRAGRSKITNSPNAK